MGRTIPVVERFWSKVNKQALGYITECWIWTAYKNDNGYGWFRGQFSKKDFGYKGRLAHRWAYEHFKKSIPDGLELDHLCKNKACVNPDHLQEVTHADNMKSNSGIHNREFCIKGHPFSGDNLYIIRKKNGKLKRACRACRIESCKRLYDKNIEKRREKALAYYYEKKLKDVTPNQ